jgi:hypothetical protein
VITLHRKKNQQSFLEYNFFELIPIKFIKNNPTAGVDRSVGGISTSSASTG